MKKTLLFLTLFICYEAQAQTPQTSATLDMTLQCVGLQTRAAVAFNPNQQLYYSISSGGVDGSYPIETFNASGSPLASNSPGFDYRGLWWNSNTNVLEGNGYGTSGIWIPNLDANYFPQATGTNPISGISTPYSQLSGTYDSIANEILHYYEGKIYRYDRATYSLTNTTTITGLPVPHTDINITSLAYTGVVDMEVGVYDYVNKAFYFINKTTGAYAMTCQLPATAPDSRVHLMGFANGRLWLFDLSNLQWKGYLIVAQCANLNNSVTQSASTLTADLSGATYQWLNCADNYTALSGEINQSFTASVNGNYSVEITKNGCVDTSTCYSVVNVGINENNFGNNHLISPNPTNGSFVIDLGSNHKTVKISIMDISGKQIESKEFDSGQTFNMLLKEPAGVYIVSILSGKKQEVIRLVKE